MPETEEEKKKREEREKKKKAGEASLTGQVKGLETPAPKPAPTLQEAADRAQAEKGVRIGGGKRAEAGRAAEAALTKERVQSVGGPADPAATGLAHVKKRGAQLGLGGSGAFNTAFKTIYAGGQAGLSIEQAAEMAAKRLGYMK